jgi:hypothetical protein
MENEEILFHEKMNLCKKRHEQIKSDILKTINAINLLDAEYQKLLNELYSVEDEYVELMKKI